MRQPIAFAVFVGVALASSGAVAMCPVQPAHPKPHVKAQKPPTDCVDLNGLPQISANIVAIEHPPAPKAAAPVDLGDKPYTGPSLGLTKPDPGVKPTPTVGFHWSLD